MRTPLTTTLAGLLACAAALTGQPARAAGLPPQDGPAAPTPAAAPFSDQGSFGVRLLDAPVSEMADPRAHEYIIDNLQPGTTIQRRIEIYSVAPSVLRASVYPDSATIADGSFTGDPGHAVSDLTTWITTAQSSVSIPAHGFVDDTVTVAVPPDAAPGERYGVIWAEVTRPGVNGSLTTVNRVGVRVYLNVGGNNPPPSALAVDTLTASRDAHGRAVVEALVHNTGGRALDLNGEVRLTETAGPVAAGPFPIKLGTTLAPGQSEPVQAVATGQIPDGPWNATVELRSGLLDESYTARITFPKAPGSAAAAAAYVVGERGHGHTWLITAGAIGLVLLGAAAFPLARRRRR